MQWLLAGFGPVGLIAAGVITVGGGIWAISQPDTVINLPDDLTDSQLDDVLDTQPASVGDGLKGIAVAVSAVAAVYLITKKG